MSNTARWTAGIGGCAVAGAIVAYLGIGKLLSSYPGEPVELDCGDDELAPGTGPDVADLGQIREGQRFPLGARTGPGSVAGRHTTTDPRRMNPAR